MLPPENPFREREFTEEEWKECEREFDRQRAIRRAVKLAVQQIHIKGATVH